MRQRNSASGGNVLAWSNKISQTSAMIRARATRLILLTTTMLWWSFAAHAATALYHYDVVHSQVLFSIDHNGYSRPFGRLHIASGWLRFDPKDWSTAATELDIDLASVDMGDAAWNAAVCKPSLLDCAKDRYAHFVSASVTRKDDQHGVLHGQLTMRGLTRPMDIAFTFNRLATTIYGMHTVAGFSATASLQRESFGITAFANSIGHDVAIWMELEAIRGDGDKPSDKETP
jgi:polyisoprenoid-binding protein YceI